MSDLLEDNPRETTFIDDEASPKIFVEALRRELRAPWIEQYWRENTLGVTVLSEQEQPTETEDNK